MKKFLTMLLALSVVFTYTFGAVGSVYATTDAERSTMAEYLTTEKDLMEKALTDAVSKIVSTNKTDDFGFVKVNSTTNAASSIYTKDALTKVGQKFIEDFVDYAKYDTTNGYLYTSKSTVSAWTTDVKLVKYIATSGSSVDVSWDDLDNWVGFKALLEKLFAVSGNDTLVATAKNAAATEIYTSLSNKIDTVLDGAKYSDTKKAYPLSTDYTVSVPANKSYTFTAIKEGKYTGKGYIAELKKQLVAAMEAVKADASTTNYADDAEKVDAYVATVGAISAATAGSVVKTAVAEADDEASAGNYATQALANYKTYAYDFYKVDGTVGIVKGSDISSNPNYDSTTKEIFGVKIADAINVTKAEADAVRVAIKALVEKTYAPVQEYFADNIDTSIPGVSATAIAKVYDASGSDSGAKFYKFLQNFTNMDGAYAKATEYAAELKAAYKDGVKVYEDSKVDEALAEAKEEIYDIGLFVADSSATGASWFAKGLGAGHEYASLSALEIAYETPASKFNDAVQKAKNAMFKDDMSTPMDAETYASKAYYEGETADVAFLQDTYHTSVRGTATAKNYWTDLANAAVAKLNKAQSYAEIEKIMADTKAEMAKLELKAGDNVATAITSYKNALTNYAAAAKTAKVGCDDAIDAAADKGKANIDEATSVAAVKAAYKAGTDAVDAVNTTDKELDALEANLEKLLKDLPRTVTLADEAKVMEAYNALVALDEAGRDYNGVYETYLKTALQTITAEKATALKKKIDASFAVMNIATVTASDNAIAAAMKEEANAKALLAECEDLVALDDEFLTNVASYTKQIRLGGTLDTAYNSLNGVNLSLIHVENARRLLVAATKEGASAEAKAAAKAAYAALTEREQANGQVYDLNQELEKNLAAEEEAAKWTDKDVKAAMYDAAKTTSYTKPSKTSVKLTAKANMTEVKENGYTVKYRFYQKGPKKTSYKLWKTSTSGAYTFKGLKKGTHSFKVKVSVYNAEGKLVAYKYTNVRTLKIK